MVNFGYALLQPFRQQNPDYNVLDLKSHYRGYRYAAETYLFKISGELLL
jgi:hypothetical protein